MRCRVIPRTYRRMAGKKTHVVTVRAVEPVLSRHQVVRLPAPARPAVHPRAPIQLFRRTLRREHRARHEGYAFATAHP